MICEDVGKNKAAAVIHMTIRQRWEKIWKDGG